MTVRAVEVIAEADVIAYHSARHGRSIARSIAAKHLRADHIEEALIYPVTTESTDHPGGYRGALDEFYETAAARLAAHLDAGRTVAVISEGDPLFYGSYQHMHKRLAHRYPTEVIPGVTSISAAAARLGKPLAEADEVLTILPGTLPEEELTARLTSTDTAVVMKLGRTFPTVRRAMERAGRLPEAHYVERATMSGERTERLADIDAETVPYFSVSVVPSRIADLPPAGTTAAGTATAAGTTTGAATTTAPDSATTTAAATAEATPTPTADEPSGTAAVAPSPVRRSPPPPRRGRGRRHRSGRSALADAGVPWRPGGRRGPRRLHHLPGPRPAASRPAPPRLRQQGRVGTRRTRPRPGPARPPGGRGLRRRPGHLRDGHRRPGSRLPVPLPGHPRTGPPGRHRRQRGRRPRRRPARPRLRGHLPLRPPQALGGHRRTPACRGRRRPGPRPLQPRLPQPHLAGRQDPRTPPGTPRPRHPRHPGPRHRRPRGVGPHRPPRRPRPHPGRHADPPHRRLVPDPGRTA
ncbi:precorrin-2 C(20)-methyltransferase [Streptomyces lydicamycinicus]|uniref:precorrin-2 C(20)-methyltransferase n=1 Tax=Streptomyces lydicamycinicus TaxID=1546107 RepID=UPI003D8084C8